MMDPFDHTCRCSKCGRAFGDVETLAEHIQQRDANSAVLDQYLDRILIIHRKDDYGHPYDILVRVCGTIPCDNTVLGDAARLEYHGDLSVAVAKLKTFCPEDAEIIPDWKVESYLKTKADGALKELKGFVRGEDL